MNFNSKNESPTGRWRDGLFDCFNNGPVCCMTWCCLPVILSQVMTRMSQNWCGGHGSAPSMSNTCMIVTVLCVLFTILIFIMTIVLRSKLIGCIVNDPQYADGVTMVDVDCVDESGYKNIYAAVIVLAVIFKLYIITLACRTRGRIREKYDIPDSCGACEDCCSSYWCLCCTVGQMARHTNDYEVYPVGCCSADCCFSKTGKNAAARAIEI